jgi:hypothetical protein
VIICSCTWRTIPISASFVAKHGGPFGEPARGFAQRGLTVFANVYTGPGASSASATRLAAWTDVLACDQRLR